MIKAASDSQQPTAPPTTQTPPSFPTYNPAQQNKSIMKNAPLPPINESTTNLNTENKPTNVVPGGTIAPPAISSPTTTSNSTATQPVMPAKPKFPDPTTKTYVKADGTKTDKSGDNNDTDNNNSNKKPKKKSNWKMAVGVIVLLFVVLGTGTGFYLTQQSQDLRQQASEDIYECPLAEACPHADGTLIACDADNVMDISECNSSGRVESCGGNDYCCPTAGGAWTTDMTACTTVTPIACNDSCTDHEECSTAVVGNFCDPATNTCRLETNPTSETCEEEVLCTQEAGTCIGKDNSCVTYTDGCIKDDLCADPIQTCDLVSCGLTGTLTDGITPNETASMSYEITSTGGDLVTAVDFIIHGNFQGSGDWTKLSDDLTPKDGLFEGNTTYTEMLDLLVSSGHDRQQVIDEGIQFVAAVYGPQGYCAEWGKWSETDADCTPCFGAIELETTTNSVSCDSITGTLTDGTVLDETDELTYEVTSSGGDLIERFQISIHGNFEGPGVSEGWVNLIMDDTPTDGILTGSTTYSEMIDLLVATDHVRQELIEKGIKYGVNVYGPEGRCTGDNVWSETDNSCTYNGACDGTIALTSLETAVICNESCTTDTECQLTDSNYVCDTTTDSCRLDSNLTSTTCQTVDDDYYNDDSNTTIGCNDICVTNSDCQDTDHICVTTADGSNRCRLTAYTSSESCVIESSGDTTTDTTTQPSLPAELPESGPADWLNWLKAGLVTMGIGTALFLLL